MVYRLAHHTPNGPQWLLKRNCSASPGQLMGVFVWLALVSLAVSLMFWMRGAVLVLPFAAIELFCLAAAFVVYARHATDQQTIALKDGRLWVRLEKAGQVSEKWFDPGWVKVEQSHDWSLIDIKQSNETVQVGHFVRPDQRRVLARELKYALLGC